MTNETDLDRLRRVAFGRTSTPEDERAAVDARRELAALETPVAELVEAADLGTGALRQAQGPAKGSVAELVEAGQPGAGALRQAQGPAARRGWILPAAVAAIVGLGVGVGIAFPVARATQPVPETVVDEGPLTPSPGDTAAAQSWFDVAQLDSDLVGVPELLPEYDRSSVRLAHESDRERVWVARQVTGALCIEVASYPSGRIAGSCATEEDFVASGVSVTMDTDSGELAALWNGRRVTVALPNE